MAQSGQGAVDRLEAALYQWSSKLMEANLTLAQALAGLQDCFGENQAAGNQDGIARTIEAVAGVRGELEALDAVLEEGRRPGSAAADHLGKLNQAVAELYAELQSLRKQPQAAQGAQAAQELTTRLAEATKERDKAREELQKLRSEVAVLRERQAQTAEERREGRELMFRAFDSEGHKRRMGEILLEANIISTDQLTHALEEQKRNPQRRLGSIFVEMGYTGEDIVAQVLASQLQVPFIRLKDEKVDISATRLVSSQLATLHMLIPVRATPDKLVVAMTNPMDLIALDDVELATNRHVEPVVATPRDISEAIVKYYSVA